MAAVTTEIGKIMITPKGAWANNVAYTRLDLVSYEGSSYLATRDIPSSTVPTNTTYWLCIAQKGDPGASWADGEVAGIVNIANGGTGASTAANARTNLGAMASKPSSIELTPSSGTTNGGFIDFHYGGSTSDYTARIIEEASGQIGLKGKVTTTGTITSSPGSGSSYIDGCGGIGAGLYVKKGTLNSDQWIPGLTIQTKTGGGWAIGNYNNENLHFVYGTKANIDSHTNTTLNKYIDTNGNYSGNAANVTGTVAIANGGTGATTAAAAWTALGGGAIGKKASLAASDIPNLDTSKLTSGTLPIARGGTGQTSAAGIRNALGLGNTTGAVPIANGGTGATTVATARQNLFGTNLATDGEYLIAITTNWASGGYIQKSSVLSWAGATNIAKKPDYSISTTDRTDGASGATNNMLYFVY